jgi:hypothetical protein
MEWEGRLEEPEEEGQFEQFGPGSQVQGRVQGQAEEKE